MLQNKRLKVDCLRDNDPRAGLCVPGLLAFEFDFLKIKLRDIIKTSSAGRGAIESVHEILNHFVRLA
jgi:hypothetical protein